MTTLYDLTEQEQRLIAADFAEHVLTLFEADYPDDDRPRKAIEAARAYARGQITIEQLEAAGYAAAWGDTEWDTASDSARAAAGEAASADAWDAASEAASEAAGAAAWDAASDAAGDAAWDAAWDAERAWQQQRIDAVVAARVQA